MGVFGIVNNNNNLGVQRIILNIKNRWECNRVSSYQIINHIIHVRKYANLANIHGLFEWKDNPFTLADLVSNLVSILKNFFIPRRKFCYNLGVFFSNDIHVNNLYILT